MKEHINVLHLDTDDLEHLSISEEGIFDNQGNFLKQEMRTICFHGNGFFADMVVFSKGEVNGEKQYFKFLVIDYLKKMKTYTVPYEVFKNEETRTYTTYSNFVKEYGDY